MNEKNLYNEIGKNIKKRRKELGITQDKLAEITNFSPSFIANIESSTYQGFSISALNHIAKALNIPLKELLPEDYEIVEINQLKCENCGLVMEIPTELLKIKKTIENTMNGKMSLTCPKCQKKIV